MEAKDCFRDLVARDSAHQFSSRKKKRKNPKSNSKIIFKFFSIFAHYFRSAWDGFIPFHEPGNCTAIKLNE